MNARLQPVDGINTSKSSLPYEMITSISGSLNNLRQGDCVVLEIDNILLRHEFQTETDNLLPLAEDAIPLQIKLLRESGIKIIGLTAREKTLSEITTTQLAHHELVLDDIIYSPPQEVNTEIYSTKGVALREYLDGTSISPKRLIVIDYDESNLLAIKDALATYRLVLIYCQRPNKLAISHDEELFPPTLNAYITTTSLGGGTASTYRMDTEPKTEPLIIKYGAHSNHIKLEILFRRLYQAMGVKTPKQAVYTTVPDHLADALHIKTTGIYQVSEFIPTSIADSISLAQVISVVKQDFAAHALLGNIDATKIDNYIISNKNVYLIDAGANFIYRALGELRLEHPSLLTELESMRCSEQNKKTDAWFLDLSESDIQQQVVRITENIDQYEKIMLETAKELELPDDLRLEVWTAFADRLDILMTRYSPELQLTAKIDKAAVPGLTAAGILTYTYINSRPYILLAKRAKHKWFDCFGGKSDLLDGRLVHTACREVAEESSGQLIYTAEQLSRSPSHDQITRGEKSSTILYRMYLCEHIHVETNQFRDVEHSDYTWVSISSLVDAIDNPQYVEEEGYQTIEVENGDATDKFIIYPPFFQMLQQAPVLHHLKQLINHMPLTATHTQSVAGNVGNSAVVSHGKRRMASPETCMHDVASTLISHSLFLRNELKPKFASLKSESVDFDKQKNALSPSEMHLKIILGEKYREHAHEYNVETMLRDHCKFDLSISQKEKLINDLSSLIANETNNPQDIYLYHACSTDVAFTYAIYSMLYSYLAINPQLHVFRAKYDIFNQYVNIHDFVAHYSLNGSKEINNDSDGYHEACISTNPFLFGNHRKSTSFSIDYLVYNSSRRPIELATVLQDLFGHMCIPNSMTMRLLELFSEFEKNNGSVLYQIHIPANDVNNVVYPAGTLGVINPMNGEFNLSTIIEMIRAKLSSGSVDYHTSTYMQSLQARYFASPRNNFMTKSICFNSTDLTPSQKVSAMKILNSKIDACVRDILYTMLHSPCLPSVVDSRSALLQAKLIGFRQSGIPMLSSETVQINLFTKAIKEKNSLVAKQILMDNPSLKMKLIMTSSSNSYFKTNNSASAYLMKPFVFIMKELTPENREFNLVTELYRETLENTLNEAVASQLELSVVLSWTPLSMAQKIICAHQRKISNFIELSRVIEHIPLHGKVAFATTHANNIYDIRNVSYVLSVLPVDLRLDYAKSLQPRVGGDDLDTVLACLPIDSRLSYALASQSKIYGSQLLKILIQLKSDERLSFALSNNAKIENRMLLDILASLPQYARYKFAMVNIDKIKDECQLNAIISLLPPNACNVFLDAFQALKNQSTDDYDMTSIFCRK